MSGHLKAFDFSIELLQEMITEGWEAGTRSIMRCVRGLPQNARFEFAVHDCPPNRIRLVFSHPTWPEVVDIPIESVVMRRFAIKEPRETEVQ